MNPAPPAPPAPPALRRLWLYAGLLLLPALAVGGLALGLLAREQARLAEREAAAGEARRAAVETRARLIAENIELLVGEAQAALMETLRATPVGEAQGFLSDWRAGNALVREVFRVTDDGRAWGGEDLSEGVVAWLREDRPWEEGTAGVAPGAAVFSSGPVVAEEAGEARDDVARNVAQFSRARQELQSLARQKVAAPMLAVAAPMEGEFLADTAVGAAAVMTEDESGWRAWNDGGGLRLFGWRRLSDGTVVGLELALDAIKARLSEVFPAVPEAGEAYALRDEGDRVWHHSGVEGVGEVVAIPLTVLPGWRVTGGWSGAYGSAGPGGVFALGATLVALLVLAILAAGGLLVREARRSEKEAALKTSFVANVSHELKTPLTTIRLYAELLAQGRVREEGKRIDYLNTIGRETQRLARLVGNVLDFSRLEQGKKQYERVEFDLAAEVRRLAEVHGPRLAEAGLAWTVEAPERLLVVTDRDAVEQIVLNLLDNAAKYGAEGGEVGLVAERVGNAVRVRVADRGPGVAAEMAERVFEKFYRGDDRLTAEKSGAGLGLSIARQLARGLGGELRYRARAGGGAEFELELDRGMDGEA